jgi:pantetheine-phosphate adenylyltransferase
MSREAVAHLGNIEVTSYSGLTINFAKERDAGYIVRGLRALSDFEWELQLSLANHKLEPEIDTVCLMASQEYSFLSSSILREIALNGGSVKDMAPAVVVEALRQKAMNDKDGSNRIKIVSVRD